MRLVVTTILAGGLSWKQFLGDKLVDFGPTSEPGTIQQRPELGLLVFCSVIEESRKIFGEKFILLSSRPAWGGHLAGLNLEGQSGESPR